MAALLSGVLWGALTTGHPLRQEPGSFPLGALAFAVLGTRVHRQERREHRPKGEAPR